VEGAFLLTFDDGFRGVWEHALPVLEKLGWPFTVFLVSDLIGGDDVWTRSSNPAGITFPLLDAKEIRDMQGRGCSFHSHTRSHASLTTLDNGELADQLAGSREALADLLGHEVRYIAYPYGHLDERVEAATRAAGYRAAFATQPGFNRRDVNCFVSAFAGSIFSARIRRPCCCGNSNSEATMAAWGTPCAITWRVWPAA